MRVAVIGAGNVGGTLGRGLAAVGHEVIWGLRDPSSPDPELVAPRTRPATVREAVEAAEVVILATPWPAVQAAVAAAGDFGGRPLLDATNPFGPTAPADSGAEQVQRWAPSAKVVKVFNTTGRENMADPRYGDRRALMLAAGDDGPAVAAAVSLAGDLGFEALPFGPLRNARLLEPLAKVWIELAMGRGLGRDIALGLLRR
jgi:predicted dinucleotide-binding enzyme